MTENNPLESAEFEDALSKLEGASSDELKAVATLIASLRDAVVSLQEQMEGGEGEEDEEDEEDDEEEQPRRK